MFAYEESFADSEHDKPSMYSTSFAVNVYMHLVHTHVHYIGGKQKYVPTYAT